MIEIIPSYAKSAIHLIARVPREKHHIGAPRHEEVLSVIGRPRCYRREVTTTIMW